MALFHKEDEQHEWKRLAERKMVHGVWKSS